MIKDKNKYVADGIMKFAGALIKQHFADETSVLTYVQKLCKERLNLIEGSDPSRNK